MNQAQIFSYRKALKNDWPFILDEEIALATNPYYYAFTDEASFSKYMQHSRVFTLLVDGVFAGYCSYEMIDNQTAELNGMVVKQAFQGKGLGKYAMNLLLKEMCRDRKIKSIILYVHPKNNIALVLYLKSGFIVKKWKDNCFNGQPRLILEKPNY